MHACTCRIHRKTRYLYFLGQALSDSLQVKNLDLWSWMKPVRGTSALCYTFFLVRKAYSVRPLETQQIAFITLNNVWSQSHLLYIYCPKWNWTGAVCRSMKNLKYGLFSCFVQEKEDTKSPDSETGSEVKMETRPDTEDDGSATIPLLQLIQQLLRYVRAGFSLGLSKWGS